MVDLSHQSLLDLGLTLDPDPATPMTSTMKVQTIWITKTVAAKLSPFSTRVTPLLILITIAFKMSLHAIYFVFHAC